jgi:ATP-dependent Lhr-like helicase
MLLGHQLKSRVPWMSSVYLETGFAGSTAELQAVISGLLAEQPDLYNLPLPENVQMSGKYNRFIPPDLLKKQFVEDYLDFKGLADVLQNGFDSEIES